MFYLLRNICFVHFVYTELEPSIPAPLNSTEEESEGELQGEQVNAGLKSRGQGGKTDAGWVQKYEVSGTEAELNTRVREILHELQEKLGVSHHPYKRAKRASPEISSLTNFWHSVLSISMYNTMSVQNQIHDQESYSP